MKEEKRASRSKEKIDSALLDSLVQLSFTVRAALARVAERHDLSLAQVRLLGILRDRTPGMMDLAGFLDLDKSSVTGLVGRAEARGLVRRTPAADDRRAVHVTLSAKGQELAKTFANEIGAELATLTATLDKKDRARLTELATKVAGSDPTHRLALLG